MKDLTEIPTPAAVDYYRLFENMDTLLKERAGTAFAYLGFHERRASLKRAREQWQRLREFRERVKYRRRRDAALAAKAEKARLVRGRISSRISEKRETIREVREARKRSKVPSVTTTDTSLAPSVPDIKIYPGTWERKTMLSAV